MIQRLLRASNGILEHANIRLWPALDRVLSLIWVTPNVHKMLLGTYTPAERAVSVVYGLDDTDPAKLGSFPGLLSMPFQGAVLTRLVDTLLRLSRAGAGTVRLAREVVDLGHVVRDVVSSLTILAEERHQQINLDVAEQVHVSCDPLVVREAIGNVINNATEYGPTGSGIGIRVGVSADRGTIVIADEGPGIAPEHREPIFDRFYRIDEGRSRDSGGTGLGLAIAKWAVEANGGRISLESSNQGPRFRSVCHLRIITMECCHDLLSMCSQCFHDRAVGDRLERAATTGAAYPPSTAWSHDYGVRA